MWATESQLVEVVQYLVSRGGDPNKKDNVSMTCLAEFFTVFTLST